MLYLKHNSDEAMKTQRTHKWAKQAGTIITQMTEEDEEQVWGLQMQSRCDQDTGRQD